MATYIRQDLTRCCLISTHDEKLTDSLWAEDARKAQQTLQERKDGPNKKGHPHEKVALVVWTFRFRFRISKKNLSVAASSQEVLALTVCTRSERHDTTMLFPPPVLCSSAVAGKQETAQCQRRLTPSHLMVRTNREMSRCKAVKSGIYVSLSRKSVQRLSMCICDATAASRQRSQPPGRGVGQVEIGWMCTRAPVKWRRHMQGGWASPGTGNRDSVRMYTIPDSPHLRDAPLGDLDRMWMYMVTGAARGENPADSLATGSIVLEALDRRAEREAPVRRGRVPPTSVCWPCNTIISRRHSHQ